MLINAFKAIVNNLFKENFYRKKKINILTVFFISYKSDVKTFLKWIVNHYPKDTINMTHILNTFIYYIVSYDT